MTVVYVNAVRANALRIPVAALYCDISECHDVRTRSCVTLFLYVSY